MSWDAAKLLTEIGGDDHALQMRGFGELIADVFGQLASLSIEVVEDEKGTKIPAMVIEFDERISRFAASLANPAADIVEALQLRVQYIQDRLRFFETWGKETDSPDPDEAAEENEVA